MLETFMIFLALGLGVLGLVSLYRAFKGPTATDRVAAMNMIVTMVVAYTLIFTYLSETYFYLDIALVFILAAFIATICILKLLREGSLF